MGGVDDDGGPLPADVFFNEKMEEKALDIFLPSLVACEVVSRGNGAEAHPVSLVLRLINSVHKSRRLGWACVS